MTEASVDGYRVSCPQCGSFVMKFAGSEVKIEVNCRRCHATVLLEKSPGTVSVVAVKEVKKAL